MHSTTEKPVGITQKALHEVKRLLLIAAYLAVFFSVFKLYKRLVLDEYQVAFVTYGYIILQSLALAKIILTGEMLRLGERFYHDKPLIVPTLYKTVMFCAFAWVFDLVEHFVVGTARGKTIGEVGQEIAEKGWAHMLASTLVIFVAFIPFFGFRELDRVVGEGKVRQLFLGRRETDKFGEPQDAKI
jgi:hypothetical protein